MRSQDGERNNIAMTVVEFRKRSIGIPAEHLQESTVTPRLLQDDV
jgi:hypothetical protein